MDQVKIALAMIQKYHFWILCVVIVALGVAASFMGTAANVKNFEAKKSDINSLFDQLNIVTNTRPHANQDVLDEQTRRTERLSEDVYRSWEKLYNDQQANNLPAEAGAFYKQTYRDTEIPTQARFDFMQFIPNHIPTLWSKETGVYAIGGLAAADPADDVLGPARPAAAAADTDDTPADQQGIVFWDGREKILQRFQFNARPSTQEVKLAQEDLWVYEAVVRVIRNVNEFVEYSEEKRCTANHNANIKRIYALEIGRDTVTGFGGSPGAPAARPTPAAGAAAAPAVSIAGRYVDENGNRLNGENNLPYKIMPIRMKLDINQMMINRLLVECANASMPIEVISVRLNPGERSAILSGPADPAAPAAGSGAISGANVPVEILGLIYIYKEPQKKNLYLAAAEKAEAEAAAEAAEAEAAEGEEPAEGEPSETGEPTEGETGEGETETPPETPVDAPVGPTTPGGPISPAPGGPGAAPAGPVGAPAGPVGAPAGPISPAPGGASPMGAPAPAAAAPGAGS